MWYCEPANSIIQLCGGPPVVHRHLGVAWSSPLRWRNPIDKGGTGGVIPRKYHDRLIALASQRGVDLPRGAFADPALAQEILHRVLEKKADHAAA